MWQIGINAVFIILAIVNQLVAIAAAHDKNYTTATYYILVSIFLLLFANTMQNIFRDK